MTYAKKIIISSIFAMILLLPVAALAQLPTPPVGQGGPQTVYDCQTYAGIPIPSAFCGGFFSLGPAGKLTFTGLVMSMIDIILWVVGILAVLFVIIGGVRYILASGNEEAAEAAKKMILHAVLGIVIVILSFVMIRIIVSALTLGSFGT